MTLTQILGFSVLFVLLYGAILVLFLRTETLAQRLDAVEKELDEKL